MIRLKKQKKSIDKRLLVLVLLLSSLGIIAVADASAPLALSQFGDKFYFVKQQVLWLAVGLAALFVISRISYRFWSKIALPLFVCSLLLLIAVLIPGVGSKILGARRWIFLGPVSIQPSEIIKLSLAVYLAKVAESQKGVFSYFLPLGLVAGLILLQPDLGTTLIAVIIGMSQIFVSGLNLLYFGLASLGGLILSALVILTSGYRKSRLLTFLQMTQDPLGRDYHIRQILLSLGSGGLLGAGLAQSRQKYLFLPEAATDSIFAVIAEEIGFIGAAILIVILVIFILRSLTIARSAPDRFSQVLATGLTAWIGGQVFLNIGSIVALIPLTGIPLPFFSYGGSSLVMILIACGILLSISRERNDG